MTHLPALITDLAIILAVAGITTLVFRKINQPVVLGYILAGFLVSPHVSLIPTVGDEEGIKVWSEIGVIFLLFTLGLEFSFKKLIKVGGAASITAIVEIVVMIGIGFLAGQWLGWTTMDSIFLGAILSVSSTTIIIRAFDEVGVRTKRFAILVFGVLIVEDLVAILLLVLLSTLAVSQQFAGAELFNQILKLGFFLTLWFLGGIFFIPTFLKRTKKLMNDETMLIVSIALCLIMVLLAVAVGFSAALGAFIMGSILAETTLAEKIEHLVGSVKTLFAAIFFVSVGMMIDPSVLKTYAVPIIAVTLITIFGKLIATSLGALLAGQSLKHSVQAGMSLAQIGEFSFIIASLGVSLKVTSPFLYPIAVAASAITTFTTPFLIKKSGNVYAFLEKRLPEKLLNSLNRYSSSSQQLSAYSDWKELLQGYTINAIIHTVIIAALVFLSQKFIYPFTVELLPNALTAKIISVTLTLLLMMPFIWALSFRRIKKEAYSHLWLNRKLNRGPLIMIEGARIIMAIILVGFLIDTYFNPTIAFIIAISLIAITIILFNQKLQQFYNRLENRFLTNLNERETQKIIKQEITPWDAHLATFDVPPTSPLSGKQLVELRLREDYGINIALIERGSLSIVVPDRHERLFPGDKLSIIGTDDQLSRIKDVFTAQLPGESVDDEEITLQNFTVEKGSRLCNKIIRNSGLREEARALVVGFERNGQRFLNPESNVEILEGDIVWIVGVSKRMEDYLKKGVA